MMICYKDRTFCSSDCINTACHRYFSDEVRQGARRWWDHDPDKAPIAFSDFSDGCEWYTQGNET